MDLRNFTRLYTGLRNHRSLTLALVAAFLVAAAGCASEMAGPKPKPEVAPAYGQEQAAQSSATSTASPCPASSTIQMQASMPTIFLTSGNQIGADCLAWQEFIYLNWRAQPGNPGNPDPTASAADFGLPTDIQPKVWESYESLGEVFGTSKKASKSSGPKLLQLADTSEFANIHLLSIGQAGNGKWLTSQGGDLVYYDVRLNLDEAQFIQQNHLTTFAGQQACASNQQAQQKGVGGLNLPQGGGQDTDCSGNPQTYGLNLGTIELKSSWVQLPADHSLDYRYLTTQANIVPPIGKPYTATVGLVGLHIIHKMQGGPQFVWATFEQIDNDPDNNNGNPQPPQLPPNSNQQPSPGYVFYSASCTPATDPFYQCKPNELPGTACTTLAPPYQPAGCDPYNAPNQVTRIYSVDSTANSATGYAWTLMPANSVFNYYRLIEVQWPNAPSPLPPGSTTPLTTGDITPNASTLITANSTAETYVQNTHTCLSCHMNAPIATPSSVALMRVQNGSMQRQILLGKQTTNTYASDYSFIFTAGTQH
ncbi:hypothetical protein [Dyella choica]|uniref:Cytochrome c family protein n=1 Tax=Dyella choica TaxID=1927959 RepID=A0A432M7M5_9GAMM|nr:hypothetical protein [Dyella choica]RUL77513.1 hypothetical protein EKH80_06375 [Dyella choica]